MSRNPQVILISDHLDPEPLFLMKSLGVQKVAHELRQAGYEVVVLHHIHIYGMDEIKHILKSLVSDRLLFIGVSPGFYMSLSKPDALKDAGHWSCHWQGKELGAMFPHGREYNRVIKDFVRELNPDVKWVVGGPDAVEMSYNKDYDYVIEGFGDLSIVNLAKHLSNGEPLRKSYRSLQGYTIIRDTKAEGFDFPNSTMEWLPEDCVLPDEVLSIEISRGCRFKCTFCAYPLNGRKKGEYIKHEDLIRKEFMDNYERFGTTRYMFVDDTFNESEEKVDMMWRISKSLPFKLEYWAYIRLDLLGAHKTMTDKLFESGCRAAFFGIETFNKRTGQIIGKNGRRDQQIATLNYIRDRFGDKIALHANFLIGLPEESIESVRETQRWLLEERNVLNSFWLAPLRLRSPELMNVSSEEFVSDIDKDPARYGYKIKDIIQQSWATWTSPWMDYDTAKEICDETQAATWHRQEQEGRRMFYLASLGYNLDDMIGRKNSELPWDEFRARKMVNIQRMKEAVYQAHGIPAFDSIKSADDNLPQSLLLDL
jgi:hypothetical protein